MPLLPLKSLQKFNAYHQAIKNNHFVQALAYCPPDWRYRLPKQLWMANRLGLYRTILQHPAMLPSKRAEFAQVVAKLKYENLTHEQANALIEKILTPRYAKFHLEFIRDIGFKYPDLIFDFIKANYQKNDYYHGLYLALLLNQYRHSPEFFDIFSPVLATFHEPIERLFLSSNGLARTSHEKLTLLNDCLTKFGLVNLELKQADSEFLIENLQANSQAIPPSYQTGQQSGKEFCVTILVTCYNAQDTIGYCLTSLLNQTWQNLEIIVIDDASSDNSGQVIKEFCQQDSRIKFIPLTYNVGTYGAKSIGALQATGTYLTCQDADDWAHPQKIERQVQPLIDNANLAVTTSYWLRVDKNGQYYARHYYPFLRQNPASPMFRREQVQNGTGLWHLVRTGADSEFFERLKLVYGKLAILVVKQPLTLASHRENSLMTSAEFGAYEHQSAVDRLDYWESWRIWHIDNYALQTPVKMPTMKEQLGMNQADFNVPNKIKINKENMLKNISHF